jgi:glycolate oxidase FAD binding subunit
VENRTDNLPFVDSVTPGDQDAVIDAVRGAWQDGTPLYPIGGGTHLAYGARPAGTGLGLSLAGLNRVVDYPARDLTITVEAGVTVAALRERLAAEGQRLPVDVPLPEQATVGGAVAVNAAGPRQFRWGTMRDYVIGLRAVDGTGTAFSAGGRVVKNAAGYGLCRLLTGSFGTLGVIVQVTLMVKPKPETSAFVACDVPDCDAAEKLLAGLIHTRTLPSAVELLSGPAWQNDPALGPAYSPIDLERLANPPASAPSDKGRVGDPSYPLRLVIGLEGSSAEVQWMTARLEEEWRQAGVVSTTTIAGSEADPLWDRLTGFASASVRLDGGGKGDHVGGKEDLGVGKGDRPLLCEAPSGPFRQKGPVPFSDSLSVRIHVLPGDVVSLVMRLRELDPKGSIQAHAGSGVVLARLPTDAKRAAALVDERLRPDVRSFGGSMVVLAQPEGAEFGPQTLFGPAPEGWAVMQSIQRQFDPKGILNRGRFLFAPPA